MSLAALLASMDQETGTARPKPLPEATCATLREVAARYARTNPFKAGDLVTPCAAGDMKNAGEPHIVLEVRDRPEPNFAIGSPTNNAYGQRCDVRVAGAYSAGVASFWAESWQFETYREPVRETPTT